MQEVTPISSMSVKVKNSQPQMPSMPLKRTKFPVKFYIPPGYNALKAEKPAIFKTATGSIPWKYSTLDAASISKVEGIAMVTQVEILLRSYYDSCKFLTEILIKILPPHLHIRDPMR